MVFEPTVVKTMQKYKTLNQFFEALYEKRNMNVVNLLSTKLTIQIDDKFYFPMSTSQVLINTDECIINYHLTITNSIRFSALLLTTSFTH